MSHALRTLIERAGRLAVLLVSALCVLVGQVGNQLHVAAAPHVVCVEHDALEDATHVASAGDDAAGPALTAAADAGEAHDACVLPLTAHNGNAPLADGRHVLAPPVAPAVVVRVPEGAPGRTGPPLLHVAPKLSPPRA